jgi:PAS domain-containing protein
MADGVVMFDKNMRLAARNPRFEEILELPATFFSAEKRYPDFLRFWRNGVSTARSTWKRR